jgi:hypothetical protein
VNLPYEMTWLSDANIRVFLTRARTGVFIPVRPERRFQMTAARPDVGREHHRAGTNSIDADERRGVLRH